MFGLSDHTEICLTLYTDFHTETQDNMQTLTVFPQINGSSLFPIMCSYKLRHIHHPTVGAGAGPQDTTLDH